MEKGACIPKTFVSVQYLRGICAVIVVLYHGISQLQRFQPTLFWPEWGAIAVDSFLFISGFAMWHMISQRPMTPAEFVRNRVLRIAPFYWVVTSVVVAVMLVAPHLLSSSRFDLMHVIASYLFIPWPHPVHDGTIAPALIPGWTLEYDVAFYALVALSLFLPKRTWLAMLTLPVIALAMVPVFVMPSSAQLYFYSQPIVIELAAGVMLAWLVWKGLRLSMRTAFLMMMGGLALIPLLPSPTHVVPEFGFYHAMLMREVFYAGPAFAIIGGMVFLEMALPKVEPSKLLMWLGDISFSLYLLHPMVLPAVTKVWKALGLTGDAAYNPVYLASATLISIGVAAVSYRIIEVPTGRFLAAKRKPQPVPALQPAPVRA
jgi:peptidoglycan/LPS O-acetylase OafA/YrhL